MSELKRGDDLFAKMGNKDAKGSASADPNPQASAGEPGGKAMSDDLTAAAAKIQTGVDDVSKDTKSASGKDEPANDKVQDPDSWTKESAFKEIKKLREENKSYREKYQSKLEELRVQSDQKLEQQKTEMADLVKAKQELDKMKEQEADKKRGLEEKLQHREQRIAEMEAKLAATQAQYEQSLEQTKAKLSEYEAAREAQNEINQEKVNKFVSELPEKYKIIADTLVKGAGDPQDALVLLNEAKLSGVFDEKQIVVNHSTPGANDGARATKEKLEGAAQEARDKMTSQQKIKAALNEIRGGTSNSAFKTR